MNSSLHQWAAEISTKQSKPLLTAEEGSMYVYIVGVLMHSHIYYKCMRINVQDYSCFLCSPQKPNSFDGARRLQTICVCVHKQCIFCLKRGKLPAVVTDERHYFWLVLDKQMRRRNLIYSVFIICRAQYSYKALKRISNLGVSVIVRLWIKVLFTS